MGKDEKVGRVPLLADAAAAAQRLCRDVRAGDRRCGRRDGGDRFLLSIRRECRLPPGSVVL
jgi:hypothetical protein